MILIFLWNIKFYFFYSFSFRRLFDCASISWFDRSKNGSGAKNILILNHFLIWFWYSNEKWNSTFFCLFNILFCFCLMWYPMYYVAETWPVYLTSISKLTNYQHTDTCTSYFDFHILILLISKTYWNTDTSVFFYWSVSVLFFYFLNDLFKVLKMDKSLNFFSATLKFTFWQLL